MSVIDHQPGAIALLNLDHVRQLGHLSLCRIEPLDDDEAVSIFRPLVTQNRLELIQPVVVERTSRRARQSYANHGTVVHELIVNDQIRSVITVPMVDTG